MIYSTRNIQARLAALGFSPGPIDGIDGRRTRGALAEALEALGGSSIGDLVHSSGLYRIHWHWTAGASGVIDLERAHYHFIIDADGQVVAGDFPPEANADPITGDYTAHTLNANTGAIGMSIDAMAGARERPFQWGSEPITWPQVEALVRKTAELCKRYWIPVSRYSALSHSEVQPTLGIRQRWKWDINVLPDMPAPGDPVEVGDRIRAMVKERMGSEAAPQAPGATPDPQSNVVVVNAARDAARILNAALAADPT